MAESAKWYVVHTYSAYENKVATNIEKVVENRKLHDKLQNLLRNDSPDDTCILL